MSVAVVRYIIFNKPFNVLCQFSQGTTPPRGGAGRQTLANYIDIPGIYPAGRLDYDSEGLLLLSDDGKWQQMLSHPKFGRRKTYWAQVEGEPSEDALGRLRKGLRIQDYTTKPAQARLIAEPVLAPRVPPIRFRANIPTCWLEITLQEGRNRQVRRMTAAVGLPTLRLVRVGIGALRLGDLPGGAWRDLSSGELSALSNDSRRRSHSRRPGNRPDCCADGTAHSNRN